MLVRKELTVDTSVKQDRKGCNYCLRYKTIDAIEDNDISTMNIDDEDKQLKITDYEDCDHYFKIHFCPLCGRKL